MEIERWQSGPDPSITVVLPTIPSTDHSDVVEKLKDQSFTKEWEILVVVDDEPTDKRCEARNIGLHEANASIVAHTDDDVSPPEDWLENIFTAFRPNVICVEGQVTGGMTYTGTGLYRGCNLAVRRDEALRIGGWNEEYVGWRDDTEFGWRLEKQGNGECVYNEALTMEHPPEPRTTVKMEQELRLYNQYPRRYRNRIPNTRAKTLCLTVGGRPGGKYLIRAVSHLRD